MSSPVVIVLATHVREASRFVYSLASQGVNILLGFELGDKDAISLNTRIEKDFKQAKCIVVEGDLADEAFIDELIHTALDVYGTVDEVIEVYTGKQQLSTNTLNMCIKNPHALKIARKKQVKFTLCKIP